MTDKHPAELMPEKTSRRRRRSSEEIMQRLLTAAEEEFKLSGFRGATTAAIAKRADVTEAQLFRYFDSKQDIFKEAVFKPLSKRLAEFNEKYMVLDSSSEDYLNVTREYVSQLQNFITDHSLLFKSLIVAEAYGRGRTESLGAIESLNNYFNHGAETMQNRLKGQAKVAPELMVRVSFAAVLANVVFREWMFPENLADDDTISNAVVDFIIEGITANKMAIGGGTSSKQE